MPGDLSPRMEELLQIFFGPGNEISREKIQEIAPYLLEPAYQDEPDFLVLPRKKENGEVLWYVISFEDKQKKEITELLISFLGPSYTDFQGQVKDISREDHLENQLLDITKGRVFSFRGSQKVVLSKMDLIYRALAQRPSLHRETIIPVGRVLRDFYMAVQAGDRELAETHLRYLKDNMLLEAANIRFLKVQMLAGLRQWREIIQMPHLDNIIEVRRPAGVTAALIQAVYNSELLPFEEAGNLEELLCHYKEQVHPRFGMLFRMRTGLKIPEVVKSFMLYATASEPQNQQLRDDLLKLTDLPDQDREFIKKFASLIPPTEKKVEADYGKIAVEALTEGDIEKAYNFALKAPRGIPRARILLDCAYEMQTLESERELIHAVQALDEEERKKFFSYRHHRHYWFQLTGVEASLGTELLVAPIDWVEWLDRLNKKGKWTRGIAHAQKLGEETGVEELLFRWGGVDKLVSCLSYARDEEAENQLYMVLPHLLQFFQRDEQWPRAQLKEVYEHLRLLLYLSTQGSDADLALYNLMCEALMNLGMDPGRYRFILKDTRELWNNFFSPGRLDWILDFGDLLFIFPCPDLEERQNFLVETASRMGEISRWIEESQWNLLELILTDAGQQEYFNQLYRQHGPSLREDSGENRFVDFLKDKYVAVYTLTERVGNRVKETLQKICPEVKVEVSSDKGGTEKLKNMARNADYFVVSWLSAKHAATEFINLHRPAEFPVKYARGKGSASIMRALQELAEN